MRRVRGLISKSSYNRTTNAVALQKKQTKQKTRRNFINLALPFQAILAPTTKSDVMTALREVSVTPSFYATRTKRHISERCNQYFTRFMSFKRLFVALTLYPSLLFSTYVTTLCIKCKCKLQYIFRTSLHIYTLEIAFTHSL